MLGINKNHAQSSIKQRSRVQALRKGPKDLLKRRNCVEVQIGAQPLVSKPTPLWLRFFRSPMGRLCLLGLSAIICLSVSIPLGIRWFGDRVFYENPDVRLTRLNVQTSGTIEEAIIAGEAGVKSGDALMGIDLEDVRKRLEKRNDVETVEVRRIMPDQLVIKVQERQPVAWLSIPEKSIRSRSADGLLIDSTGMVFHPSQPEAWDGLPVIECDTDQTPPVGQKITGKNLQRALEVVTESRDRFEGRGLELREVQRGKAWSYVALYEDGLEVLLHQDRIAGGLEDLERIMVAVGQSGSGQVSRVDLTVMKNIPVQFFGEFDEARWSEYSDEPDDESVPKPKDNETKELQAILKSG
ncbi:MAG: FtsQ-type POTRA domain-containing protein [Verrucomicrobiota bacterium]